MIQRWNRFWFEQGDGTQLRALARILGAALFCFYLVRAFDLELFYGNDGIFPSAIIPELADMSYRFSVFSWASGRVALWVFYSIHLCSLLALALGARTRIAAIVAF